MSAGGSAGTRGGRKRTASQGAPVSALRDNTRIAASKPNRFGSATKREKGERGAAVTEVLASQRVPAKPRRDHRGRATPQPCVRTNSRLHAARETDRALQLRDKV